MKKTYNKPEIMFEDFSLNISIASCFVKNELPSLYTCGVADSAGDIWFNSSVEGDYGCQILEEPDGFCYHNPSDNNNYFAS